MHIRRFDFSGFHDLAHWPFTGTCRAQPGGWRRHLTLWWAYRAWPWVREHTTCRLGLHQWCEDWGATPAYTSTLCWFCDEERCDGD